MLLQVFLTSELNQLAELTKPVSWTA